MYFYLKLYNNILNYSNNTTNYNYIKISKYMTIVYYYPLFDFILLKKYLSNFLNNKPSDKYL